MPFTLFTTFITLIAPAVAAPILSPQPVPRATNQSLPTIPLSNITAGTDIFDFSTQLRRSAEFTNAAYCSSAAVGNWSCGPTCDALGNITVLLTGGDNQLIPDFYIAYDPKIESVVVAQQGTDPSQILSLLVDAEFVQAPLNSSRFSDFPPNTNVHAGFQKAFERTADIVHEQVTNALTQFNSSKVLVTGHSLGAAIGVMNGIFLTQTLGSGVDVTTQVFGLPRAGNSAWADFVDNTIGGKFLHMHLNHDPIPTVPPRGVLDYTHPSGEVYDPLSADGLSRTDGSTAVFCIGRENENCSAGNTVFQDNIADHLGPYLTVDISSIACHL